jgi:hypothetical protein
MPHRRFTDSSRVTWDVWNVDPSHAERRGEPRDRRRSMRPEPDRRRTTGEMRVRISIELTHGWLAFESKREKRRLAPIPEGWESLDDAGLERLCAQAQPIGRPRRLID